MPNLLGKEYEYTEEGKEQYEEDKKRFRDYQPKGILYEKAPLLHKFLSFIPDPYQISKYISAKKGTPSLDEIDDFLASKDARVRKELREIEDTFEQQRKEIRKAIREKGSPLTDEEIETIRSRNLERKRTERAEGGAMLNEQMADIMPEEEAMPIEMAEEDTETMLPDEEMEGNYIDFVIDEALEPEEEQYLLDRLSGDEQLSMIFDKVVETASEFAGSGLVEGPGSAVSDSIPARLSDGEFVMTSKAANQIGPDNLQGMMEEAEMVADENERRIMQAGGYVQEEDVEEEEEVVQPIVSEKVLPTGRILPESEVSKRAKANADLLNPRMSLFAS